MVTVLVDDGQTPFEMVHAKTLDPVLKFVAFVLLDERDPMLALPDETLHKPVPTEGLFAASATLEEQTV